ncbi:hypothetical protein L1987_47717 [Smallanthus sonchifolius]|uniref:Uncharacterized protein n=1 Tax=Smallanthus sonchifolius TaxID=185202 RepID=A0ACB9G2Z7_9ASTR|nr:hypothetical protein L1987_47717 [Smallanthus sonchifolius]
MEISLFFFSISDLGSTVVHKLSCLYMVMCSSAEVSETFKSHVNLPIDLISEQVKGVSLGGRKPLVSNVAPPVQVATKPHDPVTSPNSSAIGVYSSSDPGHVPSRASRPPANVGAIKREVGPVGVCRHVQSENSAKLASMHATSVSSTKDQFRSFPAMSKTDQSSQANVAESVPSVSSGRSFSNQHSSRPHQQFATHQKSMKL